ncbi:polyprenyl synthetase family protein [Nocardia brasiliensis]|uniref:polyprenyl synthetase family protein n=1 Tax=Nocardia brasiliensis TaxID=37326 RepID=UPI0024560BF2|nr:polyprenyl synthetase family protein [Nocardia brasiliensis]
MNSDTTVDYRGLALPRHNVQREVAAFIDEPLRETLTCFDQPLRRMAEYHFGWIEFDGTTATERPETLRRRGATFTLLGAGSGPQSWQRARFTALANQLESAALLIHDDLVDNDHVRYGRPTLWAACGVAAAVHLGDALQTLALQTLDRNPPTHREQLRNSMLTCSARVLAGQAIEMAMTQQRSVDLAATLEVYAAKTAGPVGHMFSSGALSANSSPERVDAAAQFGRHLGMAIQFRNDLESLYHDNRTQLKDSFSDLRQRKMTATLAYACEQKCPNTDELSQMYRSSKVFDMNDLYRIRELLELAGATQWTRQQILRRQSAARKIIPFVAAHHQHSMELESITRF